MEEKKIKVYIKVSPVSEITDINSEIFIKDLTDWVFIDEGYGDKYAHAQNHYLDYPLVNEQGIYNYLYINSNILKI